MFLHNITQVSDRLSLKRKPWRQLFSHRLSLGMMSAIFTRIHASIFPGFLVFIYSRYHTSSPSPSPSPQPSRPVWRLDANWDESCPRSLRAGGGMNSGPAALPFPRVQLHQQLLSLGAAHPLKRQDHIQSAGAGWETGLLMYFSRLSLRITSYGEIARGECAWSRKRISREDEKTRRGWGEGKATQKCTCMVDILYVWGQIWMQSRPHLLVCNRRTWWCDTSLVRINVPSNFRWIFACAPPHLERIERGGIRTPGWYETSAAVLFLGFRACARG